MKKIGYVIPIFPTLSETFIGVEMRAMKALGHSVQPYAFNSGEYYQTADEELKQHCRYLSSAPKYPMGKLWNFFRCHKFITQQHGFNYLSLLRQGLQLAHLAKKDNCKHLHAHFAWHSAATAIVAAKLLDIPVSFVGHGADIYATPQDIDSKLQAADFICAVTKEMQIELQAATDRPVLHIPCGIDSALYPPLAPDWAPKKDFLFIGRLVEKKGLDTLIKALSLLPPDTTLDIVGDGPLRSQLQQLAQQQGVTRQIHFLGSQDAAWYRQHANNYKALVVPFTVAPNGDKDTGPLVIKEAMALGLPVITTDLAGCSEILANQYGYQVPMDDHTSLAQTMTAHRLEPIDKLTSLREKAFNQVMAQFTAHSQAQKLSAQVNAL